MNDLGDVQIQSLESVRSLDVVIDDRLSFDAHVNSVCKAANFHAKAPHHVRQLKSYHQCRRRIHSDNDGGNSTGLL